MGKCSLKKCGEKATHMMGLWEFCGWHHWQLSQGSVYGNAA